MNSSCRKSERSRSAIAQQALRTTLSNLLGARLDMHCVLLYWEREKIWRKRTCEANAAGENSSFTFTVCVKSVPRNHFKLAYVVLHINRCQRIFRNPLLKTEKLVVLIGLYL